MKRRKALKIISLSPLLSNCSNGGIEILNPKDDDKPKPSRLTLVSPLKHEPYAIWTPSLKVLFCEGNYFKIVDQQGSELSDILVLGDNAKGKNISNPNWVGENIVYLINTLENTSEIWERYSYGGIPKKLDFGLPEGKYEYPAVSRDEKLIAFTFNNKMYLSSYPIKGKATHIEIDEKIGKWCKWAGMYDWSLNGRLALVAKTAETTNIYIIEGINLKTDNTIDASSIKAKQLTEGNFIDNNPSWSSDCNYIAFDSDRGTIDNEHDIFLIKSNGTNLENLTEKTTSGLKNLTIGSFCYTYPKFHPFDDMLIHSSRFVANWAVHLIKNPTGY